MGLMLSILVICVGVIEALSCYEHFQYGVLHCAANIYESTRRSSIFLNYTSRKLGLLAKESPAAELNGKHGRNFKPFRSLDESVCISEEADTSKEEHSREPARESAVHVNYPKKKLENPDKIEIVRKHFERPMIRRPRPVRSISMPELTYTEEDNELSKMINDLAIEPIEEVEIEIDSTNPEALMKEFEKLFMEYEKVPSVGDGADEHLLERVTQTSKDSKCSTSELNLTKKDKAEINLNFSSEESKKDAEELENELEKKFSGEKSRSKSLSDKSSDLERIVIETYSKEALVKQYLSREPQKRQLKRSISAFESKISPVPTPTERINVPVLLTSTSVIPFNKSSDYDEPDSPNKLADVILENETPTNASVEMIDKTFEEIYGDLNDESSDVMNMYKEIEENIVDELEEEGKMKNIDAEPRITNTGVEYPSVKVLSENISEAIFLKAIDQLADLIVKDCLGELKHLRFEQLTESNPSTKGKTVRDSGDVLKIENGSTDETNFAESVPMSKENFQTCEILENHGERVLRTDDGIQQKHVLKEENSKISRFLNNNIPNLIIDEPPLNSLTPIMEPELSKVSDKSESGTLINFQDGKTVKKSTMDNDIPGALQAEKNTQQSENSFLKSTPEIVKSDKTPDESSVGEKTPLAIKGEALPAIQYKSRKNDGSEEINEIIAMQWKTTDCDKSGMGGNFPVVEEDFSKTVLEKLEMSQYKEESGSVDKEEENQLMNDISAMKPGANSENIYEVKNMPEQTSEREISNSAERESKEQIEMENSNGRSPSSTENIALTEYAAAKFNNVKQLAIKGETLLPLEYKTDKNDTDPENKKEIISLEWKTSIDKTNVNSEKFGRTNEEDSSVMKPTQILEEFDERQYNLEELNLDLKNSAESICSGVGATDADKVEAKEASKSNTVSDESQNLLGAVAKTEILKQKASVIEKPKSDCRPPSPDCGCSEKTINVAEGDAGNENIPEIKNLAESEKENKNEHSNDSKKLNARNNNKEVKDTNSAPEAFWLIFSGEYTKAMSKEWHSGHFSCWQCDEALTGQRYVLRDDHPYCIKCYESVFANVCEECNKIIGIDSKDLSYKDKHWHEACFLCNKCRVSLVDKQFGSKADKIYCGNCYDAQFASRCDGCGEIFRAGTKKMEYKTRQWHEKCFCCCVCKTPIGTKSFIPREQEIYCATCYEEKFATRCVKCNKIITSGGVTYKNEPWHRECFTCTNCNTSLAGQRFTSRDEKPYCADCFGELFAKRCTACSRPITGIGGTRFISFEDRHWHNDCFICASCKTSLVGRGFITDGDDIICPECAKQKLM